MPSEAQVRAALDALFDSPAPAPIAPPPAPPAPDLPQNLDPVIEADVQLAWEGETYRWFAGRGAAGVLRIFRFQRGLTLEAWHETLRKQMLESVAGPYRSQVHAQRAQ